MNFEMEGTCSQFSYNHGIADEDNLIFKIYQRHGGVCKLSYVNSAMPKLLQYTVEEHSLNS